jgi:putative oxygen-independent coproporphyrinogen III oxidase
MIRNLYNGYFDILDLQMKPKNNRLLSIYIHYPFCKSKCPYCDFNSHVKNNIDHEAFQNAYLSELEYFAQRLKNRQIKTIFFGGGTPSLMPISLPEKIISKISKLWNLDKNCEITIEANPTSFEAEKFKDFKSAGINRLSMGIQALNDSDLKFLGREHSASEAILAIETASKIFDNYSFDLIYARPNQTTSAWESELNQAIKLSPNHLSLYQLTIEKGTKFYGQHKNGEFILPNEELSADLYNLTNQITQDNNLELYEISNYARKDYECRHNLVYWKGEDYIGIGAGAHSRVYLDDDINRSAIIMLHEPSFWLDKVKKDGVGIQQINQINKQELLEEIILMGLRLKDGIDNEIFINHFNKNITEIFDFKKISNLEKNGLIRINNQNIKITDKGRILSNGVILKLCHSVY